MEVILIIGVAAIVIFAIKIAMSGNSSDEVATSKQIPTEEIKIPSNADGFFYHEMVGMH